MTHSMLAEVRGAGGGGGEGEEVQINNPGFARESSACACLHRSRRRPWRHCSAGHVFPTLEGGGGALRPGHCYAMRSGIDYILHPPALTTSTQRTIRALCFTKKIKRGFWSRGTLVIFKAITIYCRRFQLLKSYIILLNIYIYIEERFLSSISNFFLPTGSSLRKPYEFARYCHEIFDFRFFS